MSFFTEDTDRKPAIEYQPCHEKFELERIAKKSDTLTLLTAIKHNLENNGFYSTYNYDWPTPFFLGDNNNSNIPPDLSWYEMMVNVFDYGVQETKNLKQDCKKLILQYQTEESQSLDNHYESQQNDHIEYLAKERAMQCQALTASKNRCSRKGKILREYKSQVVRLCGTHKDSTQIIENANTA